jgi:RND family efflux transporter MFP subunit
MSPAHASLLGPLLLFCAASCARGEAHERRERSPLVRDVEAAATSLPPLEVSATVVSQARVNLGFKFGERVAKVTVSRGQRVKQGQLLASADATAAQLDLRSAEIELNRTAWNLKRDTRLASTGAVPPAHQEESEFAADWATSRVRALRARVAESQLFSPVDGTVFDVTARSGEVLGPGAPVIIIDQTSYLVRMSVTERDRALLAVGQVLEVLNGDRVLPATVTSVTSSAEAARGLFVVEASVSEGQPLLAGALVTVRVPRVGEPAVRVPRESLVRRNGHDAVFVIQASPTGARVQLRNVSGLRAAGTDVLLTSGVLPHEHVVAEGSYFLEDEQAVRVTSGAQGD